MRGKPVHLPCRAGQRRITPAHAGKTSYSFRRAAKPADHPRACGENGLHRPRFDKFLGSPPRMRGKRKQYLGQKNEPRITPAHAGKTTGGIF